MELAFIIWAVGTLPGVASGLCVISFVLAFISAGLAVCMPVIEWDEEESDHNRLIATKFKKLAKWVFCITLPLWVITLLVPDKTTSYQMLAAYGVQAIAENETTQELASDGVDVLKALMAKAKKELDVEK